MAEFVRIGRRRINLDQVTDVMEFSDRSVRIFWDYTTSDEDGTSSVDHSNFAGDEARLLLAILDHDDELVDALYPIVNTPNIPTEPSGIRCMLCGAKR